MTFIWTLLCQINPIDVILMFAQFYHEEEPFPQNDAFNLLLKVHDNFQELLFCNIMMIWMLFSVVSSLL